MNLLNLIGLNFGTWGIGIIDVVLVIVVVIFLVLGWKHGFLVKIVEMASGVFGIVGSILLAKPFSTILDRWIGEAIGSKIYEYLVTRSDIFTEQFTYENRVAVITNAFEGMNLPAFMIEWIAGAINVEDMTTTLVDTIAPYIKSLALLVISFIVLFFGSIIVFFILKILAKMITSIPIIKQIDKILGVLFGLVKVAAIVFILFFLLGLLLTIPAINEAIGPFLQEDMQLGADQFRLSKWIYDNNILSSLVNILI